MDKRQSRLIRAAAAGLLAAGAWNAGARDAQAHGEAGVACYGINKCQGTGDCGGKTHSCHFQNACKGQGFIMLKQETCLRIINGRLTAEPPADAPPDPSASRPD